jgi:3-(3-hydroxy-phenyl)propionate hydroxylase
MRTIEGPRQRVEAKDLPMTEAGNPQYDVAIVGYGPTGLVAAATLGRLGHRVAVIERWPALYGKPRVTHIDGETARIIQSAGDVDQALRDSSLDSAAAYTWVNGSGDVLFDVPTDPRRFHGFPESISVYQPDIEEAIDDRVRGYDNVEMLRGWALTDLDQDDDGVTLTLGTWDGAAREVVEPSRQVRAAYVIGSDGGRSRVRGLLEVEREDFGFNERWLNVDVEWRRPAPDELSGTRQYCDPARGHMFMRIGSKRQRFEFALLPGESTEEFSRPERAWELLAEYHGLGSDDVDFIRQIVYTFEARIAEQWRVGRVFLAGDAAHTMPPYMGQGACGGMRDGLNLSWKLHLVLSGIAKEAILDTYEIERRPHVTALTHGSLELGKIANMHDPVMAAARDAAMMAGPAPRPPGMPPILAGVLQPGAEGTPQPPVGTLVPQGTVAAEGREGRFDDVVGNGFVLIARERPHLTPRQQAVVDALDVRIVVLAEVTDDGTYDGYLGGLGAQGILVRPDFVLFGSATGADGVPGLLDELAAALQLRSASVEPAGAVS